MFDAGKRSPQFYFGLWICYLLPILGAIAFVAKFGVNVPAFDQWVLPSLFEKTAAGNLTFGDLFALHNTHRILFPRLIFIGLGFLSKWNIWAELSFNLGLAILSFLGLYYLSFIANGMANRTLFHLTNLMVGFLFFSLNQEWLWGFQLPIFLINFCVIFAGLIFMIDGPENRSKLLLSAGLCGVASFSSLQGLLSWLALIPGVVSLSGNGTQKRRRSLLWLLGFVVSCGVYAIGYVREPRTVTLSGWERVYTSIHFFLNLLAAPLTSSPKIAWIVGVLILVLWLFFLIYNFRKYRKFYTFLNASPWISIGLFSVLTSLLTTAGRSGLGANYPLSAVRYTTHSLLLIVAILYLGLQWISERYPGFQMQPPALLYSFLCGVLACAVWASSGPAIARSNGNLFYTQSSQTCLYLFPYFNTSSTFFKNHPQRCLLPSSKSTWWIEDGVESLQTIGFRNFAHDVKWEAAPDRTYGYIDDPPKTDNFQVSNSQSFTVGGWAIFPEKTRPPRLVFLSRQLKSPPAEPQFFANAYVNLDSPDVAEILDDDNFRHSRWTLTLSADSLPPGESTISAWVYDRDRDRFFRLRGEVNVKVNKNSFE